MTDLVIPPTASPSTVASRLLGTHGGDPTWLDRFAELLDRGRAGRDLDRVLQVWGLSRTEAGSVLGVTRQAVTKWIDNGPPVERTVAIADIAAATDLLVHHLRRERIPGVVRRPAPALGGRSLLQLWASGDTRALLLSARAMFDFGDVHA